MLMRGWVYPSEPVPSRAETGVPVSRSAATISSTVALGNALRIRANAPATCGAAIEVPEYEAELLFGIADLMYEPGAYTSMRFGAEFEKDETKSPFVVDPTVTAEDMHAGEATESEYPLLPAAITVAMPDAARVSTAEAMVVVASQAL